MSAWIAKLRYNKDQVAKLDIEYIKQTIVTLKVLAAIVTVQVFEEIYHDHQKSTLIKKEYKKRAIS